MKFETIRVLLLDDNTPFSTRLMEQCSTVPVGYSIETKLVQTIEAAGEAIASWRPGVVLFDAHTSLDNCFSLLERWKDAAFVIVTSDTYSSGIEESVIKAGAAAYTVKPGDLEGLERMVEEILQFTPPVPDSH